MTESLTGQLLVASSLVTDPIYAGGVCLLVHQDEESVIGVMLNRPMKPNPQALLQLLKATQAEAPEHQSSDEEEAWNEDWDEDEPIANQSHSGKKQTSPNRWDSEPYNQNSDSQNSDDPDSEAPSLRDAELEASNMDFSPLGMLHFGGPLSGPVVAIHQDVHMAEAETGQGIYVAAQKHHLEHLLRAKQSPFRLIVGHLGWQRDQLSRECEAGIWHQVPATPETVFAAPANMWPSVIRRATSRSMAQWMNVPDVINAAELN